MNERLWRGSVVSWDASRVLIRNTAMQAEAYIERTNVIGKFFHNASGWVSRRPDGVLVFERD